MKDVFNENYLYKCIYYMSFLFGTLMTTTPNMQKITSYTISLLWCLAIAGNQIDYIIKPWMEEYSEKKKEDAAFQKIIRFGYWTYSTVCFLSCFLPLIGTRKIEVNTLQISSKNLMSDFRRIITVSFFIVGNLLPIFFSYNFLEIKKKANSTYNLFFQDICKLGILTVDIQFVWFCWSLRDRFLELNNNVQAMISSETPIIKSRRGKFTMGYSHKYEIHQIDVAYGKFMDGVKTIRETCEERILMNILCYMFNTICGLFDTISAYRTQGTPPLLVIVHLLWVINCAGRMTLVFCATSSVIEQDDRLHDLTQIAKESLNTKNDCWELSHFLRRLAYSKVKFDICGMVTIDKTLLSSAIVSVISYLVIVLQYNYS